MSIFRLNRLVLIPTQQIGSRLKLWMNLYIEYASQPARAIQPEQLMVEVGIARYEIYGDEDRYQDKFRDLATA